VLSPRGLPSAGAGVTKQRKATLTVILITTIYVIFNVPALMYYIYLARWSASTIPDMITKEELRKSHREYFNTDFQRKYMWVVFVILFTACNSMVNPLIYYCRIRGFREFVREGLRKTTGSIRRNVDIVFHSQAGKSVDSTEVRVMENTI
jgi:hypothetical protein